MSAFVQVRDYGADIQVICPDCDISHSYDTYREASLNCRTHNVFEHPAGIRWEAM